MVNESPYLEKLTQLNNTMPQLKDLVKKDSGKVVTYFSDKLEDGIFGFFLMNEVGVAVSNTIIKKNMTAPVHQHAEAEFAVIYEGKVKIICGDFEKVCGIGEYIYFPPNTPHIVSSLDEDVKAIFITVPASEGYPGDGRSKI